MNEHDRLKTDISVKKIVKNNHKRQIFFTGIRNGCV